MGGLLGLLIQDVVVGVTDQQTVISVEENLFRELQQTETYRHVRNGLYYPAHFTQGTDIHVCDMLCPSLNFHLCCCVLLLML